MLSGSGVIEVGEEKKAVSPGSAVFVPALTPHIVYNGKRGVKGVGHIFTPRGFQFMIRYGQMQDTPLGRLWIVKSDKGVIALEYHEDDVELIQSLGSIFEQKPILSQDAIREDASQLDRYFQGKQVDLDMEVDWTRFQTFQHDVLQAVFDIPAGQTKSYGQIAKEIGRTNSSARAVGRAVATNPIPIIIPCHRVVGANGELTGYGGPGGLKTKAWLLSLEGCEFGQQLQFPL